MASAGCSCSASLRLSVKQSQRMSLGHARSSGGPGPSSVALLGSGPSSAARRAIHSASAVPRALPASGLDLPRLVPPGSPAEMKRKGKDTKSKAKGGGATSPSVTKPLTFAMVPQAHAQAGTRAPKSIVEQVRRYPKHSLLQFFPLLPTKVPKATARGTGGAAVEEEEEILLPSPLSEGDLGTDLNGRSWFAPELRTKSSHELHQLWYVLLMEKNRLATSWEEAKRLEIRGLMDMARTSLGNRNHRVRKSMARIKLVLNERRLALMQAQQQARMPIEANVAALQRQVEETPNSALWEDEAAAILASPEEEAQGMKGANTATRATAAERSGNQPKSPATGG